MTFELGAGKFAGAEFEAVELVPVGVAAVEVVVVVVVGAEVVVVTVSFACSCFRSCRKYFDESFITIW